MFYGTPDIGLSTSVPVALYFICLGLRFSYGASIGLAPVAIAVADCAGRWRIWGYLSGRDVISAQVMRRARGGSDLEGASYLQHPDAQIAHA